MKKYFYSLFFITILSTVSSFGQLEICQRQIIPEEHKIYKTLFSLIEDIKVIKSNSIRFNKQQYITSTNKNIQSLITNSDELPPLFDNRIFYDMEIVPIEAKVFSDSALVKIKLIITTLDGSFQEFLILNFKKENYRWLLNDDTYSFKFLSFLNENYNALSAESITSIPFRQSDKTLIPYRFTSDPEIWEINQKITWKYLYKWLFAKKSPIDMDLHWYGEPDWPSGTAVFCLDPYWYRIVYSKYNSSDIKSFNLEFYPGAEYPSEPWGITTDDKGKIYVTDKRNDCIIKLFYDIDSNKITFLSKWEIQGLDMPTDVVYSSGLDSNTSDDDYLLIANNGARNIIITDLNGNLINTIYKFESGGNCYNFISPTRITQIPGTKYIAIIDKILGLVFGIIQEPDVLLCSNVIKFIGPDWPTDIGVNCFGDIIATIENTQIYKFSFSGEFLCSYKSDTFYFPSRYTRINDLNYYIFDQASADLWLPTNGIKRFIPGSDAFWLNHSQQTNEHIFSYYLSDFSKVRIEIINSEEQIIKTMDYEYLCSGAHKEILPLKGIPIGNYIFRVNHRPLYDETYDEYQQGWRFSEIKFKCR